jgi:CheY-like chemotaxis protein
MRRILIADGDPAVRAAIRMLLEYEGFEVLVTDNGALGLEAVELSRADLVVLDLGIPRFHGLAALKSTRMRSPALPVIAISGCLFKDLTNAEDDALTTALALGAAAALRKPFKPRDLLDAIAQALDGGSSEGDWRRPKSGLPVEQ